MNKICLSSSPKLTVMYKGELENAEANTKKMVCEVEEQVGSAAIHANLLVKGIVSVK